MSELPKGWVNAKLGDYVHLKNGFAFKSKDYSDPSNMTVPVIRISDINGTVASDEKANHVSTELAVSEFVIAKGDLLVAMSGATTGKIGVYGGRTPAYQNQRVGNLKLNAPELSDLGFRNHLIKYLSPTILEIAYGGAQPNISASGIESIGVCLPPLAEQKRIVAKLDEVLAQVDTIKARLDGIPAILKRFRQSVLAAAVSGKLTDSAQSEDVFLQLGNVGVEIKTGPFGSALHKADYIEGGISVINPMHINDGQIQPASQMTITKDKFDSLNAWHLKNGDVILGRRGEMGRAAVVKNIEVQPLLCGTGSMFLRCGEQITPEYLCYILRSPVAVHYFNSTAVGSTMVNLNQKVIRSLKVYVPVLKEQKEIVRLVDQYFTFADTIEVQVKKAQARVDNLTQSILAKAFRGELVPQDPDDEPAEMLLARIAQARKEAEALAKAAKKAAKAPRKTASKV
jgi:type I restriction enzyme, S subunit